MEVKFSSIACTIFLVLGSFYLCEAATSEAEQKCADDVTKIVLDLAKSRDEVKPKLYKSKCAELKNTLSTCKTIWADAQDHVALMGVYHEQCLTESAMLFMNINHTSVECSSEIKVVTVTLDTEYLKEKGGNRTVYNKACSLFRVLYQECKAYLPWDQQLFLRSQYMQSCESKEVKEFMNLNLTDVKRTSAECGSDIKVVTVKLDTEYIKVKGGNRTVYKEACTTFRGLYQECKAYLPWDQQLDLRSQYMQSCESKEIKEWYKSSSIMLHGGFFSIAVAVILSLLRNSV